MIFSCSQCGTRYQLPDDQVKNRVVKVRCTKCKAIVSVRGSGSVSAPDKPARQWFVAIAGEQKGPLTERQLLELISAGTVTSRNYAWSAGMSDWARFGDIPAAAHLLAGATTPSETRPKTGPRPTLQQTLQSRAAVANPSGGGATAQALRSAAEEDVQRKTRDAAAARAAAAQAAARRAAQRDAEIRREKAAAEVERAAAVEAARKAADAEAARQAAEAEAARKAQAAEVARQAAEAEAARKAAEVEAARKAAEAEAKRAAEAAEAARLKAEAEAAQKAAEAEAARLAAEAEAAKLAAEAEAAAKAAAAEAADAEKQAEAARKAAEAKAAQAAAEAEAKKLADEAEAAKQAATKEAAKQAKKAAAAKKLADEAAKKKADEAAAARAAAEAQADAAAKEAAAAQKAAEDDARRLAAQADAARVAAEEARKSAVERADRSGARVAALTADGEDFGGNSALIALDDADLAFFDTSAEDAAKDVGAIDLFSSFEGPTKDEKAELKRAMKEAPKERKSARRPTRAEMMNLREEFSVVGRLEKSKKKTRVWLAVGIAVAAAAVVAVVVWIQQKNADDAARLAAYAQEDDSPIYDDARSLYAIQKTAATHPERLTVAERRALARAEAEKEAALEAAANPEVIVDSAPSKRTSKAKRRRRTGQKKSSTASGTKAATSSKKSARLMDKKEERAEVVRSMSADKMRALLGGERTIRSGANADLDKTRDEIAAKKKAQSNEWGQKVAVAFGKKKRQLARCKKGDEEKIRVEFTVMGSGRVSRATVKGTTNDAKRQCIRKILKNALFPRGGTAEQGFANTIVL